MSSHIPLFIWLVLTLQTMIGLAWALGQAGGKGPCDIDE